jgi:hypothetical protein
LDNHSRSGGDSVRAFRVIRAEAVQHGLGPFAALARRQFEHHSVTMRAAFRCPLVISAFEKRPPVSTDSNSDFHVSLDSGLRAQPKPLPMSRTATPATMPRGVPPCTRFLGQPQVNTCVVHFVHMQHAPTKAAKADRRVPRTELAFFVVGYFLWAVQTRPDFVRCCPMAWALQSGILNLSPCRSITESA